MANKIELTRPFLIPFIIKNGKIKSSIPISEISQIVLDGKIVILKSVFSKSKMHAVKDKIVLWGKGNPVFPHGESPSKYPLLNYHRIDDGSVASVCPHIFHQYGFNSISKLEKKYSESFSWLVDELLSIQNAIAQTNFDISLNGMRLKVLQYPQGGGFLQQHAHPVEPQKIGLILSLSELGVDLEKGAAAFLTNDGFINTESYHEIGDIILFRYDLPHEVTPIDPGKNIDWSLSSGKWSVVLELRETHNLSHKQS